MRTSVSDAAYPVVSLTAQPVPYREMRREKSWWTTLMAGAGIVETVIRVGKWRT